MAAIAAGTAASFHATEMAKTAQGGAVKPTMLNVASSGGRMRMWYDTITVGTTNSSTWTNGSFATIAVLPQMAKVWSIKLHISASLGGSTTIAVGYLPTDGVTAGVDDTFFAAAASTSAGWKIDGTSGMVVGSAGFELPKESFITLEIAGANASGTATIRSYVEYTID